MNNNSLIPSIFKKTLEPFREVEKSFTNFLSKTPTISYIEEGVYLPNINIDEDEKEYHVRADIPGVEGKDVRIEFSNGMLILRGEKITQKEEDRSKYHISERSTVNFNHTIQLPIEIDEQRITATLENGVIEVVLSKLAEADRHKTQKRAPKSKN